MSLRDKILLSVLVLLLGLLLASYGGALHAAGDAIAVFRKQIAQAVALMGLVAITLQWRKLGLAVFLGASLAWVPILWAGWPNFDTPPGALTVYQKNLSFRLSDPDPILADIRAVGADFVTLQEVDAENQAVLAALRDRYPNQWYCDFAAVGGVAVLSVHPFRDGSQTCAGEDGIAAAQAMTPKGPVWLVSIHLHWPWPFRQPDQVRRLISPLKGMKGKVIAGGDMNMVPWSHSIRSIEHAARVAPAGHLTPTFHLKRLLWLPIDHVFAPVGCESATSWRPRLGSDHRGQIGWISLDC